VNTILRENLLALRTWPDARMWWRTAKVVLPALAILGMLAWIGGFLNNPPRFGVAGWLANAALLFVLPAFAEELFFRGLLLSIAWRVTQRWAAWISVIGFVAWYPLQALLFGFSSSSVFTDPLFLLATIVLGMVLSHVRIISRSLWPAILVHWLVVLCWQLL
jgi:uncharacterized protein